MSTNTLASLIVSLEANTAKFETSMNSAVAVTQRSLKGMEDAVASAQSKFLNLAASVVSIGAAVKSVKEAIDLGDELKTMSDATGIAVSKLDELSIMAKLNNANLDDVAKGFKGLTKAMVESGDSSSKQAKLFEALGVSVKDASGNLRGTDQVMGDVAKALNSIENETTRAAVGTAIFGKSYLQIAATLRNFEEDQKSANEVIEKFGGVSVRAASLADELGDKFTLLGEGSKRALLAGLVPGMAAAGQAIQELINQGGAFQTSFGDVISKVVTFVSGSLISLKGAFEVVGTTIAAVAASIATGSLQPLKDLPGEIDKIEARVKAAQARIAGAAKFPGLDDSDAVSRAAGASDRLAESTAKAAISSKKLADILAEGKAKADPFAKAMDQLQKSVAGADEELLALTAQSKDLVPIQKALAEIQASDLWKQATQAFRDQFEALAKVGIATQQTTVEFKKLAEAAAETAATRKKEYEDWLKQQSQVVEQTAQMVKSYSEANDTLEAELAVIGESNLAHQRLAATLQYEAERRKIVAATTVDNAAAMDAELAKLEEQFRRRQDLIGQTFLKTQFVQAQGVLSDFLYGFLTKSANVWESFKQMAFRALAEIASRQIVVSIVGAISGVGVSGVANAAGGFGAIGNLSNIGSAAGAFGAASGAGITAGIETIKLGMTAGLESIGGIAGLAGAVSTFLPYAAIAAIAIPLVAKLFDKGPATRTGTFASGPASLLPDASRDAVFQGSSAFGAFGIAKDFWLGPEAGAAFKPTLDAITTLDNTISKMVGGDLTREIADALAQHSVTVGLGKEGTDINASGGPAAILKDRYVTVLNTIDSRLGDLASSFEGTGQELATFVVGLVGLRETFATTFKDLDTSQIQALGEALGGIDKLAAGLSFINQNFVTAADSAVQASQGLSDSFSKLGLQVPATHQAFLDLLNSFDLTTESGRSLYAAVIGLSGAFVQVNGTATQAAAALQQSFASLNAAVASFNGVPAEQQKSDQLTGLLKQLVTSTGNTGWQAMIDALGPQGFVGQLALLGQMPEEFAKFSTANQALITQIIAVAAEIKSQGSGALSGVAYPGDAGYPFQTGSSTPSATVQKTADEMAAEFMKQFADLAGQSTGNFGEKLALQIRLVTGEIATASRNPALAGVATILRRNNADLNASLTLFDSLKTRYSDSISEQLVKLSQSFEEQARSFRGNADALDVLNTVFEEQWTAIVNGTAAGVDGTLDQLSKLQDGILGYVASLRLSADSPLTPLEKLNEARSQYEATLAKAGTGDQKALGDVTGSADAFLKLARQFYASSPAYTEIFNQITGELTALGTKDFGPAPLNAADQALLDALPKGSTIMSALDLQDVAEWMTHVRTTTSSSDEQAGSEVAGSHDPTYLERIARHTRHQSGGELPAPSGTASDTADAIASAVGEAVHDGIVVLARSNSEDSRKTHEELRRTRAELIEAITLGRK